MAHTFCAVHVKPAAMLPGDAEAWIDPFLGCNPAQTDNELWLQQSNLGLEPFRAGVPFCIQRIPV